MRPAFDNAILSRLDERERRVIAPHLVPVELKKGELLGDSAREPAMYFVEGGVLCVVAYLTGRDSAAVAITGREGVGGAFAVLGDLPLRQRLLVQIDGAAFCVPAAVFRERRDSLPHGVELVERYIQVLIAQTAQSAICNRYHSNRERLARWLLLTADVADTTELPLTHAAIADMVGGARSLVTTALIELRDRKAIDHHRGVVTVNRARLRRQACECYDATTDALRRMVEP